MMLRFRTPVVLLLLSALAGTTLATDRRPYADGPLSKGDFLEEPRELPAGGLARTATELLYKFDYTYKGSARNTTAMLDRIEINAYIRRDKSFNLRPDDKGLMDHEQGHADIAQIHCLRARLAFQKTMRKGRIEATGSSLKDAQTALNREIERQIQEFVTAMRDADAEYDRATSHGLGGKQPEWRRVQLETLKQLEAEWGKR
jgi:hypothetical protein